MLNRRKMMRLEPIAAAADHLESSDKKKLVWLKFPQLSPLLTVPLLLDWICSLKN